MKKVTSIIIIILILLMVDLNVGTNMGFIKLPTQNTIGDFTNKNISEVIKWAAKNKIDLIQIEEFSETIEENIVISQSEKENTLTNKVKKVHTFLKKFI